MYDFVGIRDAYPTTDKGLGVGVVGGDDGVASSDAAGVALKTTATSSSADFTISFAATASTTAEFVFVVGMGPPIFIV